MSPTLVVVRPPSLGLRPISTLTFLALVTLSPDPSLSPIGGFVRGFPLSCCRGGKRIADPLRGDTSSWFVSNDVTEVTEARWLSLCELVESARVLESVLSRVTAFVWVSGEFDALLTCTVTRECWFETFKVFCFSFSFAPRSLNSRNREARIYYI